MERAETNVDEWDGLRQLRLPALKAAISRQPPALWLASVYLMFEYVRPQTIYPLIDFLPWTAMAAVGALLASFLQEKREVAWSPLSILMLVFGGVVLASSVAAYDRPTSIKHLDVFFNWLVIYFALTRAIASRIQVFLMLLVYLLCNLKMTQFGFRSWASSGFSFLSDGVGGAPGWFQNSGEFGIQLCIAIPIYFAFAAALWHEVDVKRRVLLAIVPVTGIASLIATSSRGAIIGFLAATIWSLRSSAYFLRSLALAAIVGGVIYFAMPPEFMSRFSDAGTDRTSIVRLDRWEKGWHTMVENPFLGIGHRNWELYYFDRLNYGEPGTPLVHNMFIECGAELGFIGLGTLVAMLVAMFIMNGRVRRIAKESGDRYHYLLAVGFDAATIGLIISGCFVTVLYYPYVWVQAAMTTWLYRSALEGQLASKRPRARLRARG